MVSHKQRALKSIQQVGVVNIAVKIMDKHTGFHIPFCIDVQISSAADNTVDEGRLALYTDANFMLKYIAHDVAFKCLKFRKKDGFLYVFGNKEAI